MRAADLLDWHPRIERPADPRHAQLLFHYAGDATPLPATMMPEWIARAAAAAATLAKANGGIGAGHLLADLALGRFAPQRGAITARAGPPACSSACMFGSAGSGKPSTAGKRRRQ